MATKYWDAVTGSQNLGTATNWDADTNPVAADDVYIDQGTANIDLGLSSFSAVLFGRLVVSAGFLGTLGAIPVLAATPTYAQFLSAEVDIGQWLRSTDRPAGSARILMDMQATASDIRVWESQLTGADTDLQAVRLLMNNAATTLTLLGASEVGIASSNPAETSTLGTVTTLDPQATANLGPGVTITTLEAVLGSILCQAVPTTITVTDGLVKLDADAGTVTTATVGGSGTLDLSGSGVTVTNAIELSSDSTLDLRGFTGTLTGGWKFTGREVGRILLDPEFTV